MLTAMRYPKRTASAPPDTQRTPRYAAKEDAVLSAPANRPASFDFSDFETGPVARLPSTRPLFLLERPRPVLGAASAQASVTLQASARVGMPMATANGSNSERMARRAEVGHGRGLAHRTTSPGRRNASSALSVASAATQTRLGPPQIALTASAPSSAAATLVSAPHVTSAYVEVARGACEATASSTAGLEATASSTAAGGRRTSAASAVVSEGRLDAGALKSTASPMATGRLARPAGEVTLNVYDLTHLSAMKVFNQAAFSLLAGGAFHIAVEVWKVEYSYGYTPMGTGIYRQPPGKDSDHSFRESVRVGTTTASRKEVQDILKQLAPEWCGNRYHWAHKNCCHFAHALCQRLGAGPLPEWVDLFSRTISVITAPLDGFVASIEAMSVACKTCRRDECCGRTIVVTTDRKRSDTPIQVAMHDPKERCVVAEQRAEGKWQVDPSSCG